MGKKKKRSRNRLILWLGDITKIPTIQAIIYCLVLQDLLQILLALDINFQHFYALEHDKRVNFVLQFVNFGLIVQGGL